MKKLFLIIGLITVCFQTATAQLPNASFENWNQGLPDGWFSALIPGYPVMVQSTDAHAGAYAVQLNVVNINGNPYGSSISTGSIGGFTVPFTSVPSAINFWYKLTSIGGDQLSVLAFVYSAGSLVALGSTQLNSATAYSNASFNLINLTGATVADSIQISFLINNPAGTTHVGSSTNIDEVSVVIPSGISSIDKTDEIKIGPVPAKDELQITLKSVFGSDLTCNIYDMKGNKIKSITVLKNQTSFTIDVTEIPNGTYVFQLINSGQSFNKIVAINK